MTDLFLDIRYALRGLRKNPAFAAIAIATLAFGIAANTAIFSVVNAVLLRPLRFEDADRLVVISTEMPKDGIKGMPGSVPDFRDWSAQAKSFEAMGVVRTFVASLRTGTGPERVAVARVSPSLLALLRVQTLAGSGLASDSDSPSKSSVALISSNLWQSRFGGASDVIGRTAVIDDRSYAIVGVLPSEKMPAEITYPPIKTDVWIPFVPTEAETNRGFNFLWTIARLKPGVTLPAALAEMNAINSRTEAANPTFHQGWRLGVAPLKDTVVGDVKPALLVVLSAVGCLLLITCVNIATLLLARTLTRRGELAVRTALGASRRRIARQLLTESLCISAIGGVLGIGLAAGALQAVVKGLGPLLPRASEVRVDGGAVLFSLLAATAAGLLFGMAPAVQGLRGSFGDGLRQRSRGSLSRVSSWVLRGLVVAQTALALALLLAAGLMLRSFAKLSAVSPGFEPRGLYASQVDLAMTRYRNPQQHGEFWSAAVERVRSAPGVGSAAVISRMPMLGGNQSTTYQTEDNQKPPTDWAWADARIATPGYFATMRIPLLRGRDLEETDRDETPHVIVINRDAAARLWPHDDAVGKRVQIFPEKTFRTVVGVVGDVKLRNLEGETGPTFYIPFRQNPFPTAARTSLLVVRTDMTGASTHAMLRRELAAIDDGQAIGPLRVVSDAIADSLSLRRFTTALTATLALLAVALAVMGVYGVVSFSVSARQHDIGVRAALGAQRHQVLWWVLRQGVALAALGVGIGLVLSAATRQLLARVLYGLAATDAPTWLGVAALLLLVASAGCYVPARRASRIDPLTALRQE